MSKKHDPNSIANQFADFMESLGCKIVEVKEAPLVKYFEPKKKARKKK